MKYHTENSVILIVIQNTDIKRNWPNGRLVLIMV